MLLERDRQDDRVGLERIAQRLGDDRGADRFSLRRQRLGRAAARDDHVDVLAGEGVGEGLADLAEPYDRVAHDISLHPFWFDPQPSAFNGAGVNRFDVGRPARRRCVANDFGAAARSFSADMFR